MHIFQFLHRYLGLWPLTGAMVGATILTAVPAARASVCPQAALAQTVSHRVSAGETLETVARQYGLLPASIVGLNSELRNRPNLVSGQTLDIPPFNGLVAQTGSDDTWQTLGKRYGVRADILFEVNGCEADVPDVVFIPGSNHTGPLQVSSPPLTGYPLPAAAPILLSYGWQPHPQRDEIVFNSGIALGAAPGTEVRTVADGVIAFVGEQGGRPLVVVNHRDGLQTRYGNVVSASAVAGASVSEGSPIGIVAARGSGESFLYFEVRSNSQAGWVARDPRRYIADLELR